MKYFRFICNSLCLVFLLGCSFRVYALDIAIPKSQLAQGVSRGEVTIAVPLSVGANWKLGQVNLVNFKKRAKYGTAKIVSNQIVVQRKADLELGLGRGATRAYLLLYYGIKSGHDRVRIIKLNNLKPKTSGNLHPLGKGAVSDLPFVRLIDKKETKKMMGLGAMLLDVRLPSLTGKFTIPGSGNLSLITSLAFNQYSGFSVRVNKIRRMIADDYFVEPDKLSRLLKISKTKKIIIYCENEIDPSCIRSLIKLNFLGAKNLHWYYGGVYDWNSFQFKTPSKIKGVTIVNTKELRSIREKKHVLIDTRDSRTFEKRKMKDSRNVFYKEPGRRVYRLGEEPKNKSDLKREGYKFKLKMIHRTVPSRETPIVVLGHSSADWAAYKATLLLRDIGYSQVYYYRDGFYAWHSHRPASKGGKSKR